MDLINQYFNNLSPAQQEQFLKIEQLYLIWNQKINVISRQDINNFYKSHVLHSLSIAKFINFKPGSVVLDAGTGGGFPGVPLAILFPKVNFICVDSTAKKLTVIDDVCKQLNINNVKTIHTRIESLNINCDFVISRAVSRLDTMWAIVKPIISNISQNSYKNGLIYLKGGDISNELPNNVFIQKIDINELFDDTIFDHKALVYISSKKL